MYSERKGPTRNLVLTLLVLMVACAAPAALGRTIVISFEAEDHPGAARGVDATGLYATDGVRFPSHSTIVRKFYPVPGTSNPQSLRQMPEHPGECGVPLEIKFDASLGVRRFSLWVLNRHVKRYAVTAYSDAGEVARDEYVPDEHSPGSPPLGREVTLSSASGQDDITRVVVDPPADCFDFAEIDDLRIEAIDGPPAPQTFACPVPPGIATLAIEEMDPTIPERSGCSTTSPLTRKRIDVFTDRRHYKTSDGYARAVVSFVGSPVFTTACSDPTCRREVVTEIRHGDSTVFSDSRELASSSARKLALRFPIDSLDGHYLIDSTLILFDGAGNPLRAEMTPTRTFDVSPGGSPPPFPSAIEVVVTSPDLAVSRYPVTGGIPLPEGMICSTSGLVLEEQATTGHWNAVPAQFSVRSTWSGGTIKWLGLDFDARYKDLRPRRYRLRQDLTAAAVRYATPLVRTRDEARGVDVITSGRFRWVVGTRRFSGVDALYYDANGDGLFSTDERQLTANKQGPYVIGPDRTLYGAWADPDPKIEIIEEGPLRLTYRASGWYTSGAGRRLHRFETRMTFRAGAPFVAIDQRTIFEDPLLSSHEDRLHDAGRDFGWTVTTRAREHVVVGVARQQRLVAVPGNGDSRYIVQDRHDGYRAVPADIVGGAMRTDGDAAGFVADRLDGMDVGLTVRDFAERFPNEVEVTRTNPAQLELRAHFWAAHGTPDAYTQTEVLARENLHRLLWAHIGPMLSLSPPPALLDRLWGFKASENEPPESEIKLSLPRNVDATGMSLSSSFALFALKANGRSVREFADAFNAAPLATGTPDWNTATGVVGQIAARVRGSVIDQSLDDHYSIDGDGDSWHNLIPNHGVAHSLDPGLRGRWIRGESHDGWDASRGLVRLGRALSSGHYLEQRAAWVQYLRSGRYRDLKWARATTDQHQDVRVLGTDANRIKLGKNETCNAFDGHDPVTGLPWHYRRDGKGAMRHVYSFVPWGGAGDRSHLAMNGHWHEPSAYTLRWEMEGDDRAHRVAEDWLALQTDGRPSGDGLGGDRNAVAGVGELTAVYELLQSPQAVVLLGDQARIQALRADVLPDDPRAHPNPPGSECPVEPRPVRLCSSDSHSTHCNTQTFRIWGTQGFRRYFDYTRDACAVQRVREYLADNPELNGGELGHRISAATFAYQTRDVPEEVAGPYDARSFQVALAKTYAVAHEHLDAPGHWYNGFSRSRSAATGSLYFDSAPYVVAQGTVSQGWVGLQKQAYPYVMSDRRSVISHVEEANGIGADANIVVEESSVPGPGRLIITTETGVADFRWMTNASTSCTNVVGSLCSCLGTPPQSYPIRVPIGRCAVGAAKLEFIAGQNFRWAPWVRGTGVRRRLVLAHDHYPPNNCDDGVGCDAPGAFAHDRSLWKMWAAPGDVPILRVQAPPDRNGKLVQAKIFPVYVTVSDADGNAIEPTEDREGLNPTGRPFASLYAFARPGVAGDGPSHHVYFRLTGRQPWTLYTSAEGMNTGSILTPRDSDIIFTADP